jgi:hypothetical protein
MTTLALSSLGQFLFSGTVVAVVLTFWVVTDFVLGLFRQANHEGQERA